MNRRSRAWLCLAFLTAACAEDEALQTEPALPESQNAIVQTGFGGPEVLAYRQIPVLAPGAGQVLIEVRAAGVNPVDWKIRGGYMPGSVSPSSESLVERVPGFDAAGVIVSTGPGVEGFAKGDAVLTMMAGIEVDGLNGAYSEYVVAPAENIVRKPESMTFEEAAGLPTVGMTAAKIMYHIDVEPGTRVFVDGIAGGVGSSVAQIAKARGAFVIGTASGRHHEYLRSLGVDEIIDYTEVDFEDVVEPVDAYVETVNAGIAERGLEILSPGGPLVSVVGTPDEETCAVAEAQCIQIGPLSPGMPSEGELIGQVAGLVEVGQFRVNVDQTYPLAEAAAAQEANREGHTQGKIVLVVEKTASQ